MRLFNHDIRGSGPRWLRLSRQYASRALCLTAPGDVIQLPSTLRPHWAWIRDHYRRCGLNVTDRAVWDLSLERLADYPDHELSSFFFGEDEQRMRPDPSRRAITDRLNSKSGFIELAREVGALVPDTRLYAHKGAVAEGAPPRFPCYVKPDVSLAGVGIARCADAEALARALEKIPEREALQLQQALDASAFLNLQFSVRDGRLERLCVSERLSRGRRRYGNRAAACHAPWPVVEPLARKLVEQGLRGVFGFDVAVVEEGGEFRYYLIGGHPRYTASTYCHETARRLGVEGWEATTLRTGVRSLSELGIGELEYDPATGQGVVVVDWGGIRHGRPEVIALGKERGAMIEELERRVSSRRPVSLALTPPPQPPGDRLLLSPREMEWATGGRWVEVKDGVLPNLTGVSLQRSELRPGELYVYHRRKDPEGRLAGPVVASALARGAVAAMVRAGSIDREELPRLEVNDTQKALQDLATAASLKFDGSRVMVVGSHGKTGFKTQLHHLIHRRLPVHAHLSSKNLKRSVWRTLAAIPRRAECAIVEVAIPTSGVGRERALLVRPDFCVFTGIGPEHMRSHRTLERLIHNKADAVTGLRPGGRVVINADDEHFEALRTAIRRRSDASILTFGSAEWCDGRLIEASFEQPAWHVRAEVLGEEVVYTLPLLERYAPVASVGVLLMARLLGVELAAAAAEYAGYRNFMSSGNLYRIHLDGGPIHLYDQSRRGELKGFESTFELMARLQPPAGGRKILVTSEFINLEDNPGVEPDLERMKGLLKRAGIDLLYSVKAFERHAAALPEGVEWRLHGADAKAIEADLLATIRPNDMIFLRGVLAAGLSRLADQLRRMGEEGDGVEQLY